MGRAILLSIACHLMIFGLIDLGRKLGWWEMDYRRIVLLRQAPATAPSDLEIEILPAPEQPSQKDLAFLEVTPAQSSVEPPEAADFYSSLNSKAANPDVGADSNVPKIEGTQEKVPKTTDTPKVMVRPPPIPVVEAPKPEPLVSAVPQNVPVIQAANEPVPVIEKIVEETTPDVLEVGKPREEKTNDPKLVTVKPADPPVAEPRKRPRTLAAVVDQASESQILGERMKQAGGVRRFGIEPSFDVLSSEFGAYDAAIIAAIQRRWYDLLEDRDLPRSQVGKVVLEFRLTADGRITNMREQQSSVSPVLGLMCQRAVQDPAPYAQWPMELRRLVGRDYREVRFVFHYN